MQAREPIVSIVERQCILDLLLHKKRLDGRSPLEFRKLDVKFTQHAGGCIVDLGGTKVFSQVSCEITRPRPTRPNEGVLFVNLEFTPMASPSFEAERPNDVSIEANRIIERCLVDSRCLDMESLCIISGEVVWEIKLDIRVLNNEGNMIDTCCISAIAALCDFKRPDVSVFASDINPDHDEHVEAEGGSDGSRHAGRVYGRIKFHPSKEKALLSLNVQHMPVCVTLCFYDQGRHMIVDPTRSEELCIEGKMVVAVNNQKEVCTLHLACGGLMLTKSDFISNVHHASKICSETIIKTIKEALTQNETVRKSNNLQSQLEAKLKLGDHKTPIAPINESKNGFTQKMSRNDNDHGEGDDDDDDLSDDVAEEDISDNKPHLISAKSNWIISDFYNEGVAEEIIEEKFSGDVPENKNFSSDEEEVKVVL